MTFYKHCAIIVFTNTEHSANSNGGMPSVLVEWLSNNLHRPTLSFILHWSHCILRITAVNEESKQCQYAKWLLLEFAGPSKISMCSHSIIQSSLTVMLNMWWCQWRGFVDAADMTTICTFVMQVNLPMLGGVGNILKYACLCSSHCRDVGWYWRGWHCA